MIRRLAVLLLFLVAAPGVAQTFPQLTGRVVDQANIIPDDREAAMVQQLEQLQRASSRQLVVATVSSLEGHEIQEYAYRLGRHWRIGQSEANNGVVLLVAPNERRVWITVGYGLEGILTDAFTGQVVRDRIIPRFRENDYPGGIEAGVQALIAQLAAPPEQAEQRALEAERARGSEGDGGGGIGTFFIVIAVIFVGGFIFLIVLGSIVEDPYARRGGKRGRRRRGSASPWGASYGGSSWGGSSWGSGGSSWGGGSWGGGGGGFSGGGGSFGGGGAGGSW